MGESDKEFYRRDSDPSEADFRALRYVEQRGLVGRHDGSYQKWIAAIVGAGLVTSLGWFVARDRVRVDNDLITLGVGVAAVTARTAGHEAELQVIKSKQDRMLADLQQTNAKLDEHGRKLDLVLAEMRKATR